MVESYPIYYGIAHSGSNNTGLTDSASIAFRDEDAVVAQQVLPV